MLCRFSTRRMPGAFEDGKSLYFSPCHAGCGSGIAKMIEQGGKRPKNVSVYDDCKCLSGLNSPQDFSPLALWRLKNDSFDGRLEGRVVEGYCPESSCRTAFFAFLGIIFVTSLYLSGTRIPNMLISLRVIAKEDKAASFTFSVSFLSLLAFLPGPLIFGSLFDASCEVWGKSCTGESTNCLVYDSYKMRTYLGSLALVFMILGLISDIFVWKYISPDLDLYGEDESESDKKDDDGMVEIELKEKL